VFSALEGKDIDGIVQALAPVVSAWFCAGLPVPRGLARAELAQQLEQSQSQPVSSYDSLDQAWQAALQAASNTKSVVLVAGSFYTVAEVRSVAHVGSISQVGSLSGRSADQNDVKGCA